MRWPAFLTRGYVQRPLSVPPVGRAPAPAPRLCCQSDYPSRADTAPPLRYSFRLTIRWLAPSMQTRCITPGRLSLKGHTSKSAMTSQETRLVAKEAGGGGESGGGQPPPPRYAIPPG